MTLLTLAAVLACAAGWHKLRKRLKHGPTGRTRPTKLATVSWSQASSGCS